MSVAGAEVPGPCARSAAAGRRFRTDAGWIIFGPAAISGEAWIPTLCARYARAGPPPLTPPHKGEGNKSLPDPLSAHGEGRECVPDSPPPCGEGLGGGGWGSCATCPVSIPVPAPVK